MTDEIDLDWSSLDWLEAQEGLFHASLTLGGLDLHVMAMEVAFEEMEQEPANPDHDTMFSKLLSLANPLGPFDTVAIETPDGRVVECVVWLEPCAQ